MDNFNDDNVFPLEIEKSSTENKLILYLKGRLDTQTSEEFQQDMEEYLDEVNESLVLDFSEIEYLSSAGLRAILYITKKLKTLEGEHHFSIINVRSSVMEVFDMTGFTDMINILPIKSGEDE